MMKKKYTIWFVFCLSFLGLFAQNDGDAEEILKKISSVYQNINTSEIDIELILDIPDTEEDIITKGKVWLKDDMFKIDFEERMLVSNTVTQWTYLKEVNEVQISDYDPNQMLFLPSKIFDDYNEEYIFRLKEEYKNEKNELVKVIELTPLNKDYDFFKIIMHVNTSSWTLVSTEIYEKSGMKFTYNILGLKSNIELNNTFFDFNPNKYSIAQEDITDLR